VHTDCLKQIEISRDLQEVSQKQLPQALSSKTTPEEEKPSSDIYEEGNQGRQGVIYESKNGGEEEIGKKRASK